MADFKKSPFPLALLTGAALLFSGVATAEAQRLPSDFQDQEAFTDPAKAEQSGFSLLEFSTDRENGKASLIEREFMPKFNATLPEPAPGFGYAMADLDGDGGPELFLRVMHWTLCEAGCPVHIYRFEPDGQLWKEIFVINASSLGIRPPTKAGERPAIAALSDGPDGRGPTSTTFYRWGANDRFVKFNPDKSGQRRK